MYSTVEGGGHLPRFASGKSGGKSSSTFRGRGWRRVAWEVLLNENQAPEVCQIERRAWSGIRTCDGANCTCRCFRTLGNRRSLSIRVNLPASRAVLRNSVFICEAPADSCHRRPASKRSAVRSGARRASADADAALESWRASKREERLQAGKHLSLTVKDAVSTA